MENRRRNLAGTWRGPVAILSGASTWDPDGARIVTSLTGNTVHRGQCHPGHYIGVVDLVDVHHATEPCCGPWAQAGVWHHVLANAIAFATPIPARGHLGLRWITDNQTIHAITTQITQATASP